MFFIYWSIVLYFWSCRFHCLSQMMWKVHSWQNHSLSLSLSTFSPAPNPEAVRARCNLAIRGNQCSIFLRDRFFFFFWGFRCSVCRHCVCVSLVDVRAKRVHHIVPCVNKVLERNIPSLRSIGLDFAVVNGGFYLIFKLEQCRSFFPSVCWDFRTPTQTGFTYNHSYIICFYLCVSSVVGLFLF